MAGDGTARLRPWPSGSQPALAGFAPGLITPIIGDIRVRIGRRRTAARVILHHVGRFRIPRSSSQGGFETGIRLGVRFGGRLQ